MSADISSIIESVASTFTSGDNDGQLKLGSINASVNGWQDVKDDISFLKTVVSSATENEQTTTYVTADVGTFDNLTVGGTATFSATTVSATTLTIGGSTVEQLADKQIAAIAEATSQSTSAGITVGVTTSGGSVTAVTVNAGTFGNVMHFRDTVSNTANVTNPVAGDIVIITGVTDSSSAFVNGQEYIYTTASTWELIGDQNSYALNAYTSSAEVLANASTLPGAVDALGAAVDTLNNKTGAYVGGASTSADQGVSVTVEIDASTMAPTVTTAVTSATLFGGLDASVSSSENNSIKVGVTQVDGVVTGVTADLVWLDENNSPIVTPLVTP